jgi:hypothetical protein
MQKNFIQYFPGKRFLQSTKYGMIKATFTALAGKEMSRAGRQAYSV